VTRERTFREEHALADGTPVTLRFIRPDDADGLRRSFARLSARSRYQRFLAGVPELTDEMVAYLTQVDGQNHVAVVATTDSLDLKTELGLGVARFVRLAGEPDVAEAAVTVVDDVQGKGVGRLLLTALTSLAMDRGVRAFRGEVLVENTRMCRMLAEVGATVRVVDGQTLVFDVPLQEPRDALARQPSHPLRRLLRAAAESLGMGAEPPA
jgi:GNAT superfamily N-acetyltransferase